MPLSSLNVMLHCTQASVCYAPSANKYRACFYGFFPPRLRDKQKLQRRPQQ
jgi:hypothetical protein